MTGHDPHSGPDDAGTDAGPAPTSNAGDDANADPDVESGDGSGDDGPVEVGDDREKYVAVTDRSGNRTEHVQVYLRHTTDEFVVSHDDSFRTTETTRYPKTDLSRVEITQHHSVCFITTAVAGESETLDVLRAFRDDALRRTLGGKALVSLYYRISPPVARTLSEHPTARTTRLVRWLVTGSARLARRREAASSRPYRGALALALTLVYVFGVCCAIVGHAGIRLREPARNSETLDANA